MNQRLQVECFDVQVKIRCQVSSVIWRGGRKRLMRSCAVTLLINAHTEHPPAPLQEKLAAGDPTDVVANTRFLGRVQVPLSETLTSATSGRWYPLMRRSADDVVSGQVLTRPYTDREPEHNQFRVLRALPLPQGTATMRRGGGASLQHVLRVLYITVCQTSQCKQTLMFSVCSVSCGFRLSVFELHDGFLCAMETSLLQVRFCAAVSTLSLVRQLLSWLHVAEQVRLAFEWDITAKGLLALQLGAMERVLAQRQEILCMLSPVLAPHALAWAKQKEPHRQREHKVCKGSCTRLMASMMLVSGRGPCLGFRTVCTSSPLASIHVSSLPA